MFFTIHGHGGRLNYRPVTICTKFQSPFNSRLYMKFKKIGTGVSEKFFKGVEGRMTTDDNGRQVITIAHPEPSAQMS